MHFVYGSVYLYGYVSIHICYAGNRVGRLQLKWKGILVDGLTTVILVGGQQLLYAPCDSVRGPSSVFLGGCTRFVFTSALVFYEYFIIFLLFLTYYNFML